MCAPRAALRACVAAVAILVSLYPSQSAGSRLGDLLERIAATGSRAGRVGAGANAAAKAALGARMAQAETQVLESTILGRTRSVEEVLASSAGLANRNTTEFGEIAFLDVNKLSRTAATEMGLVNKEDTIHNVYVVAPDDTPSYTRVFQGSYNDAYLQELKSAQKILHTSQTNAVFARATDGRAAFHDALKTMQGHFVSVIGHNEAGLFKFLNGDAVHLAELARICNSLGKKCIFFSCDAQSVFRQFRIEHEIGANTQLNYLEAARATAKLDDFLKHRGRISTDELLKKLPAIVDDAVHYAQMSSKVTVITVASGAAVAVAALVVTLDSSRTAQIQ